jgi:hypothetical protein
MVCRLANAPPAELPHIEDRALRGSRGTIRRFFTAPALTGDQVSSSFFSQIFIYLYYYLFIIFLLQTTFCAQKVRTIGFMIGSFRASNGCDTCSSLDNVACTAAAASAPGALPAMGTHMPPWLAQAPSTTQRWPRRKPHMQRKRRRRLQATRSQLTTLPPPIAVTTTTANMTMTKARATLSTPVSWPTT